MNPPTEPKPAIVIDSIGGACPAQAEGRLHGYPFYFRARHGRWTLSVALPDQDPVMVENPFVDLEGEDPSHGYMAIQEVMCCIGDGYRAVLDKVYAPKPNDAQASASAVTCYTCNEQLEPNVVHTCPATTKPLNLGPGEIIPAGAVTFGASPAKTIELWLNQGATITALFPGQVVVDDKCLYGCKVVFPSKPTCLACEKPEHHAGVHTCINSAPAEPNRKCDGNHAAPVCPECDNTGIIGDEGPGMSNVLHEWHPCRCPHQKLFTPATEQEPGEGAGGGAVCLHGIRHPWECKACADAAWEERQKAATCDCETCNATGKIDQRLGGYAESGVVDCPDCDGQGTWISATPEAGEGAGGGATPSGMDFANVMHAKMGLVPFSAKKGGGEKCQCKLCQRGRRFNKIIKALPDEEQDWMSTFYDSVMDTEEELEMREASEKQTSHTSFNTNKTKDMNTQLKEPMPPTEELPYYVQSVPCSTHPDAPHGFDRDASHTAGRYVCDCEGWVPPDKTPCKCSFTQVAACESEDCNASPNTKYCATPAGGGDQQPAPVKGPVCGLLGCTCHWCNMARRAHANPEAFKDMVTVHASELQPKQSDQQTAQTAREWLENQNWDGRPSYQHWELASAVADRADRAEAQVKRYDQYHSRLIGSLCNSESERDRLREAHDAAIRFIKELNATTFQHGRQYRSRCGQFLTKALNQNTNDK